MTMIDDVLRGLLLLPGATYSCVAVRASGELVAEAGGEPIDPAVVVRWARSAADFLAGAGDDLDDLMITSRWSYRLVRPVDDAGRGPLLLLLCLDRSRANLAVARRELSRVRLDAAEVAPQPRSATLSPAKTSSQVDPPEWMPLPRRVPAAIPPPAPRTPPTRRPRWPGTSRSVPSAAGSPAAARARVGVAALAPDPDSAEKHGAPGAPDAPVTGWADDVGTMRRLLDGLRALR
ncbi:hypothetical protein ACVGOW_15655 [Pseudonocardia saturnea]